MRDYTPNCVADRIDEVSIYFSLLGRKTIPRLAIEVQDKLSVRENRFGMH